MVSKTTYVSFVKPSVYSSIPLLRTALQDLNATVYQTPPQDSLSFIEETVARGNADVFLAAGGDGTINEVINAVVSQKVEEPVGVIACGSGNAAYWNYKIGNRYFPNQTQRITDSMHTLYFGKEDKRDLLDVEYRNHQNSGKRYSTWVSLGFSAAVVEQRQNMGTSGYIFPTFREIFQDSGWWFKERRTPTSLGIAPHTNTQRKPLLAVFAADVQYFGQGLKMSHYARSNTIAVSLYNHTVIGALLDFPFLVGRRDISSENGFVESINFSTQEPVEGDGELLLPRGDNAVSISLEKKVLTMIVGK